MRLPAETSPTRLLSLILSASIVAAAPQVQLGITTITGRNVTLLQQDFFGGIPYAQPPVGPLRLQPTVYKGSLDTSTFNASNFGPACLQPGIPISQLSEDCLTINIFRPSVIPVGSKLPVMFWTYGGGFLVGAGSVYNGSGIVAESVLRGTPVIYVNFNYRLGPLGFPQGQEAANLGALNLALRDQIAALRWVQDNIGAFGGDKNQVTVFGESAGSIMTSIQFLNPSFGQYARAAIFESGSAATSLNFGPKHREASWQSFVQGVPDCSNLATTGNTFGCLKTVNSTEILQGFLYALVNASEEYPFDPTIDGPGGFMPDVPSRLYAQGQFARLPFIAGTNLDEGTDFIPTTISSEAELSAFIIANYTPALTDIPTLQAAAAKLLTLYPEDPALGSPYNTGSNTFGLSPVFKQASSLLGDVIFQSLRRFWQQTTSNSGVKSYGYLFTQPQTTNSAYLGVTHGTEVVYVYGAPPTTNASDVAISRMMMDYWISFATSLNPNDGKGSTRPNWSQYTPQNQVLMQLNGANTTLIPDDFRSQQIGYINSIPLVFHH